MSDFKIDHLYRRFFNSGNYKATPKDWAAMEALLNSERPTATGWTGPIKSLLFLLMPALFFVYLTGADNEKTTTSDKPIFVQRNDPAFNKATELVKEGAEKPLSHSLNKNNPNPIVDLTPSSHITNQISVSKASSIPLQNSIAAYFSQSENPADLDTGSEPKSENDPSPLLTGYAELPPSLQLIMMQPIPFQPYPVEPNRLLQTVSPFSLPNVRMNAIPFVALTAAAPQTKGDGSYVSTLDQNTQISRNYSLSRSYAMGLEAGIKWKGFGFKTGLSVEKQLVHVTTNEFRSDIKEQPYTQSFTVIEVDTTITGYAQKLVFDEKTGKYQLMAGSPVMDFDTTYSQKEVSNTRTVEVKDSTRYGGSMQVIYLEIPLMGGYEWIKGAWLAGIWTGISYRRLTYIRNLGELDNSAQAETGRAELRKSSNFILITQVSVGRNLFGNFTLHLQPGIRHYLPSAGNSEQQHQTYPGISAARTQWYMEGSVRYTF